jgi:RsmE family RNA methyltransferase
MAVNLLLLLPGELDATQRATLVGRRARHVHDVLRAAPGQQLQAGLLNGPLLTATVEHSTPQELVVSTRFDRAAPPPRDTLLLAVPRPKVLLRMLQHAAALGFADIVLFRSWRVEKSHLQSSAMDPAVQHEQLCLGLEQAGRTQLPTVRYFPLFKPMVEDELPQMALPALRFCADPRSAVGTAELAGLADAPLALALGPDGGFLPYELTQLANCGFLPIHCGRWPLRTESALSVLSGQLALLRARGSLPW